MLRMRNPGAKAESGAPTRTTVSTGENPARPESRFNLFSLLPAQTRTAFIAASRPRTVLDGSIVYHQGDVGHEMFHIISGEVRLFFLHPDGRELVFTTFEPGDCFGISSLIDGAPLPHTAEARGRLQLHVVSRNAFERLRADHRPFEDALLQLLCRHMRVLSTYVTDATLDGLSQRLARRLLDVARPGDDDTPAVRQSQAELSLMFGVSRQTINKLLQQFEHDGLVRLSYGAVLLRDRPGLRRRAAAGSD